MYIKDIGSKKLILLRHGFTLAEVLITLGIIGFICAMTIPTLMQNMQDKQTSVKLEKMYSVLSQAYTRAIQENGPPQNNWASDTTTMLNTLVTYLKIMKNCGTDSGCWLSVNYKFLNDNDAGSYDTDSRFAKAQLADGTLIFTVLNDSNCLNPVGTSPALQTECGLIDVDINGFNPPNQYGIDFFQFYITQFGIIPRGTQFDNPSYSFDSSCKDKTTGQGYGCAAWVLYKENMDYLHCNNLSWDGPTKCQ